MIIVCKNINFFKIFNLALIQKIIDQQTLRLLITNTLK